MLISENNPKNIFSKWVEVGKIRRRRKQRRKKKFWVFLVMYFKNFEKFFEVIITKVVQKNL